jgi:hypothetical protein
MKRFLLSALLCSGLCLPITAQQSSAASVRIQAIRDAHSIHIDSRTAFLTTSTLERALMKNKDWEKLDLNLVSSLNGADLEIEVDRLPFTHIHTYVLSDRETGIVLASGRVRAFDGVVASGPMAEKIVSFIFAARFPALPANQ